jgi:hypothetical protein
MAISEQVQQIKDELVALLARHTAEVSAFLDQRPQLASEMRTSTDALFRELMALAMSARTFDECMHVSDTIVNVLRETADEFEAEKARSSRS